MIGKPSSIQGKVSAEREAAASRAVSNPSYSCHLISISILL